jgi:uncharacterized protein YjiS (DUF1127 family)
MSLVNLICVGSNMTFFQFIGRRLVEEKTRTLEGNIMFEFFSKWKKQRQTIRELERLTNRELADLGISRCDIREIARQNGF